MSEKDILTAMLFVLVGIAMVGIGGWRASHANEQKWKDKAQGLSADLDYAVEVCFKRGATEFVRLNYPKHFARLSNPALPDDLPEKDT